MLLAIQHKLSEVLNCDQPSMRTYLNLGYGSRYHPAWINIDAAGLDLIKAFTLDGYTVPELGERVAMKTFVCRKRRG